MNRLHQQSRTRRRISGRRMALRRGAAAVECAMVSPLLVILVLGAIDVGQLANVAQTVSNASREGARQASRNTIDDADQVESAVMSYLGQAFPGISSDFLDSATTISIVDSTGQTVIGTDLGLLPSGEQISVTVSFQYEAVRWISGFPGVNDEMLETTTIMRRD